MSKPSPKKRRSYKMEELLNTTFITTKNSFLNHFLVKSIILICVHDQPRKGNAAGTGKTSMENG
jgi:hypothetical protein